MIRPVTIEAVAHHEGGHALARWWLGFHTDRVTVLTVDQVRSGVTIEDRRGRARSGLAGAVDGYAIELAMARYTLNRNPSDEIRNLLLRQAPRRVEAAVLESFAGPQAEARFRRCSIWTTYLFGGEMDLEWVKEVSLDWFETDAARMPVVNRAEKLARALVRSPKGQIALTAMAADLANGGSIDGDRVDALCSEAYGAEFLFDRWADAWPPTLKQIRDGYLPTRSQ